MISVDIVAVQVSPEEKGSGEKVVEQKQENDLVIVEWKRTCNSVTAKLVLARV